MLLAAFVVAAKGQEAPRVLAGDFESPALTGDYQYNLEVGPRQPWKFTGHSGIARQSAVGFNLAGQVTGQFGFLQSPNSSFSQMISFSAAGEFKLTYMVAGRIPSQPRKWGGKLDYVVSIAPAGSNKSVLSANASTEDSQPFKAATHRFSISIPGDYILLFKGAPGQPHDDSALFDDISITSESTR